MKLNDSYELEVGVDIAKSFLKVHLDGDIFEIKNTKSSITTFLSKLTRRKKTYRVTCESTGGYEDQLIALCLAKNVPVSQCNPIQIKNFIRSFGKLAKTDAIDAKFISKYATDRNPQLIKKEWINIKNRREIQRRVEFLTKENTRRKNSIDKYDDSLIINEIKREIKSANLKIKKLRERLEELIKKDPTTQQTKEILESVVGIGPATSIALINTLPELGTVNRREIASLVGLAPMHQESGTMQGYRKIYGGRKNTRSSLYIASVVAATHNQHLKGFYQKLKGEGKQTKVAIIAVARKLLIHLNSLVKKELQQI